MCHKKKLSFPLFVNRDDAVSFFFKEVHYPCLRQKIYYVDIELLQCFVDSFRQSATAPLLSTTTDDRLDSSSFDQSATSFPTHFISAIADVTTSPSNLPAGENYTVFSLSARLFCYK